LILADVMTFGHRLPPQKEDLEIGYTPPRVSPGG
jgi:hypothetical protein